MKAAIALLLGWCLCFPVLAEDKGSSSTVTKSATPPNIHTHPVKHAAKCVAVMGLIII